MAVLIEAVTDCQAASNNKYDNHRQLQHYDHHHLALTESVTGCQAASSSTATRDHLTLVEEQQRLPWAGQ